MKKRWMGAAIFGAGVWFGWWYRIGEWSKAHTIGWLGAHLDSAIDKRLDQRYGTAWKGLASSKAIIIDDPTKQAKDSKQIRATIEEWFAKNPEAATKGGPYCDRCEATLVEDEHANCPGCGSALYRCEECGLLCCLNEEPGCFRSPKKSVCPDCGEMIEESEQEKPCQNCNNQLYWCGRCKFLQCLNPTCYVGAVEE